MKVQGRGAKSLKQKEGCKMDIGTFQWMQRIEQKLDYIIAGMQPTKKETKKEINQKPGTE